MNQTIRNLLLLFPPGRPYYKKVLSYGPFAYWPLWEPSGAVAQCLVNPLQNGTHVGVTLGQPGIGDGRTCPYYDGVNDYTYCHTAALAAAFNGAEGTIMAWMRADAGTWTDAARRACFFFRADGNNYVEARQDIGNNTMRFNYCAGGVLDWVSVNPYSELGFFQVAMTWSASADELRCFLGGTQRGATQVGLGIWAGALAANYQTFGAASTTPTDPWKGYGAHGVVWTKALPPAAIANLAVV